MCGIVGIVRLDGGLVAPELIGAMADRLVHRGPDGAGTWTEGSIGFGHRRLAIIDPAGSPQPMASADGRLHVTFNGEIVNYAELRAATPYPYRTRGDTEVLLALHQRHGPSAVERLRGQFAYALHDGTDLWLHRDRLGILPLYYVVTDDLLAFASEIKALLPAMAGPPQVDHASLDAYLARRAVPAPFTLVEGVRKLLPGHRLRLGPDGDLDIEPYWRIPDDPPTAIGDADAIDQVERALVTAVRRSLVADVEVGSLLSGGVDSSLVVALASAERGGRPIETFAGGFGDPRTDELDHARVVAERFGTRHHEVVVDAATFEQRWRRLTWHRDAPLSEPADVAVHALALEAADSVKVLLSGEGSDELFGGYPKYTMARWGRTVGRVPATLRAPVLRAAEQHLPSSLRRGRVALRALAEPTDRERVTTWFAPFTTVERNHLLDRGEESSPRPVGAERWLAEPDPLRQMLAHDRASWLADNLLERGDRMTMAASVELRPPLLDHELVELAASLPSDVLVRGRTTKWVLKEVARHHLPSSIVDRPKAGFRVPLDAWFRGHLRDLARDSLLASDSFVGSVMDRGSIAALLTAHERGRRDESIRIWTLLALEQWHDVLVHDG
jgi:asparagine synthase (glutamine-hydrolysing)